MNIKAVLMVSLIIIALMIGAHRMGRQSAIHDRPFVQYHSPYNLIGARSVRNRSTRPRYRLPRSTSSSRSHSGFSGGK